MKKIAFMSIISLATSSALFSFNFDENHLDEINKKFGIFAKSLFDGKINNYPAMNIYERDSDYLIELEIIGINQNDMEVSISDNRILSISGNKPDFNRTDSKVLREERFVGKFQREIVLPNDIDSASIDVKNENGILKITVLKDIKKTGKRVIPIK